MTYEKQFTKPYPNGYEDSPSKNTPVTAEILNMQDRTLLALEEFAANNEGGQGEPGEDGVSVSSIEQTTTSTESGGTNVVTCILSNGTVSKFNIKNGVDGKDGEDGTDGKSAYQTALDNGFEGTEAEWVASLDGSTMQYLSYADYQAGNYDASKQYIIKDYPDEGTSASDISFDDTTAQTGSDNAQGAIEKAVSIAKGRNQAHVFSTTTAMQECLSNADNAGKYNVGDNLYIVEVDVPDWWVAEVLTEADTETGYFYKIAPLETQKVDLTEIESEIATAQSTANTAKTNAATAQSTANAATQKTLYCITPSAINTLAKIADYPSGKNVASIKIVSTVSYFDNGTNNHWNRPDIIIITRQDAIYCITTSADACNRAMHIVYT